MQVTIIGYGNMARAIATRAVKAGHTVQILGRDPEKAQALAQELGGDATAGSLEDGITGELVVPALYYQPLLELVDSLKDQVAGKVVIDITNPVDVETFDGMLPPGDSSGAQELQQRLEGAKVVKAFNTTFAVALTAGEVDGKKLDVLIAADDEGAKRIVTEFVESLGLEARDAGSLKRAREVEAIGFLQMAMQGSLGNTWSTTFKILGA